MGIINVLDIHVANLIAAGEVVDRPASAVKELVENSIDAGATKITVEIKKGGISFIRVCDNGKGMSKEDVPVCIQRHATSKIKDKWDLGKIMTLGFRGEALAAISSVSKIRIMTKRKEDKTGTLMMCEPGGEVVIAETGCPEGTTVIVEELFANVPARRKFLKKDMTEGMAISNVVEKLALSRPDVAFKFISDDSVKFATAGDGKLSNAIYALYGRDFIKKMTPVEWLAEGVKVYGYVGNPDNVKSNRNHQVVFVNDRFVRNKTVSAALEQAYDSYIPEGKFPCCVLKIDVHPAFVDANVHPTKAEVKFSDEKQIFEVVYFTVRSVLEKSVTRPELFDTERDINEIERAVSDKKKEGMDLINAFVPVEERDERNKAEKITFTNEMKVETDFLRFGQDSGEKDDGKNNNLFSDSYEPEVTVPPLFGKVIEKKEPIPENDPIFGGNLDQSSDQKENVMAGVEQQPTQKESAFGEGYIGRVESPKGKYVYESGETDVLMEKELPFYRILGEAFFSYIFVEMADKVLIIDKHAAHERMIFEELKGNMKKKRDVLQFLLVPLKLDLDSVEKAAAEEYFDDIAAIGFEMRWEDNGNLMVYAIPVGLDIDSASQLFMTVLNQLSQGTGSAVLSRDILFEKALYQASCKAAIKAGRPDAKEDTEAFVKKLIGLPDIRYCPHGRPVAFELTKDALEKQFKRK